MGVAAGVILTSAGVAASCLQTFSASRMLFIGVAVGGGGRALGYFILTLLLIKLMLYCKPYITSLV